MASSISKSFNLFILLTIVSVGLIISDHYNKLFFVHSLGETVFNPVKMQASRLMQIFHAKNAPGNTDPVILQAKIDLLELEINSEKIRMSGLEAENAAMKAQLGSAAQTKMTLLPAKNISAFEGVMTINKGSRDGVKPDSIVFSGGTLVGLVTSVTSFSARVDLPGRDGNSIDVTLFPSKDKGIVKGTPEGRLVLTQVLQKVRLEEGQIIVTSGSEGKYPPDTTIGKIAKVIKDDVQIYQKAEIKPAVDYARLDVVMVRI